MQLGLICVIWNTLVVESLVLSQKLSDATWTYLCNLEYPSCLATSPLSETEHASRASLAQLTCPIPKLKKSKNREYELSREIHYARY